MSIDRATVFANFAVTFAIMGVVGTYSLLTTRQDPRRRLMLFALGGSIPFFVATGCWLGLISRFVTVKLDEFAYCADKLFGEPSFAVGQFLGHHEHLRLLALCAYLFLQGALVITGAAYILTSSYDKGMACVRILAFNFLMSTPFYLAFPIAGPAQAFAGFPWILPSINVAHVVSFYGAPNGMPSVHTSSALLILYFARRSKIGAALASFYLVLIVISTLGFGEHYLIDLFAAVPYTAGVIWLGNKLAYRNPVQNLDATLERI